MNQQLTSAELASLPVAIPVLTKREKLFRLASLIRHCGHPSLYMFSNLEYRTEHELAMLAHPMSAFALAAQDGILKDAGLAGSSVADAKKFFQLSPNELHRFSCGCAAQLCNEQRPRTRPLLATHP